MKKLLLFALMTVLLCALATTALAITLWEGGPDFATSSFQDPFPFSEEPLRLLKVEKDSTTGEAATWDSYYNYYSTEHGAWKVADAEGLGIDAEWHIPTQQDIEDLIDKTILSMVSGQFCFTSKTDSSKQLLLPATGGWRYDANYFCCYEDFQYADHGFYVSTGQFLHLIPNTPSYEFINQSTFDFDDFAGEVILVRYPVHEHSYTFSASGATLTATCQNCPDSLKAELTVSGSDSVSYSGSPVTLSLSGDTVTWETLTGKDLPAVAYSKKLSSGSFEPIAGAPTDVGTFRPPSLWKALPRPKNSSSRRRTSGIYPTPLPSP